MKVPFVDLKPQYQSIKPEIDAAIAGVIENTSFIGGGIIKDFEKAFAEYIGVDHCVACANGTDAIEIALQALGIGEGDEVIVPAITWIATAGAVKNVGAEPVFVDLIEREFTMNPDLLEDVITDQTKAIIPVHLYGLPCRMPEVMAIARKHDLYVLEDCAQAHGANIDGKTVGTFGDIATFSFYPGKNLGAYGDAGGIVTNDENLANTCRMICNHGQPKKHVHKMIGRNSRMDTMQAAILNVKLPHLTDWTKKRQQVAEWYGIYLPEEIKRPRVPEEYEHVYHLYVIRAKNREEVLRLLDDAGIGHAIHYPTALPFVNAFVYKDHDKTDFPVAHQLSKEIISIPMFSELKEEQVKYVSKVLSNTI